LIDEARVFERFHEALDVELRPGAFDRLQAALVQGQVRSRQRTRLVLPFPRAGLRVAAALVAVLLVVAIVAAFLAFHLSIGRTIPARPTIPRLTLPLVTGSNVAQVLPQKMFGSVGWADGGPQRTTDGGLHWQAATPPAPANLAEGGNTSYFLDADHAWVTMATGADSMQIGSKQEATMLVIFATSDRGRTWSHGSVPISGFINESARLDFIDPRHGWVVTDSGVLAVDKSHAPAPNQPIGRAIYATTDGGRNWSRLAVGTQGDRSTLGGQALGCPMSGLTFASLERGWLTWDCFSSGPATGQVIGSMLATTQDGGRSWTTVELPSFPTTSDYACGAYPPVFTQSNGALAIACGGIGRPGFNAVYATADSGRTWSFRKLPFFSGPLDFLDANSGWTFGSVDQTLYRTTDGGSSWVVVSLFSSEKYVNGYIFTDVNTGFVLTARYSPDGSSGFSTLWNTTDGGQTWSVISSVPVGPPGG
jgi:photosystem II stability/assembly factor-like uncharacterized protein